MKNIKLNVEELSYICTQMNLILSSGLTVQEGLEVLLEDTKKGVAYELLTNIYENISEKKTLYKALKLSGAFPGYMINMVRIGELTGRLEEIFEYLANYYENESDMRKTIKTVLFQPIILLCMMFLVVGVLVIKIIPTFVDIFNRINMDENTSFNKTMMYSSNMGVIVLVILSVIIGGIGIIMLLMSIDFGKKAIYSALDSCIFTRKLSLQLARARFSKAMTVMIKSGVDTTEAIEYASKLVTSKRYRRKIENCRKKLLDNQGFVESLTQEGLFDGMNNQMLKVSYKTGAYESAWSKISDIHNEELKENVQGIVQSIEPIIVTILTITIGAILISVMLPLIGIMSQIG